MNIDEQRKAFEKYELSKKPEGNPKLMFQRFEVEDLGIDEQSYVGKYYNSFMEEKWELWLASANREGYKLVPAEPTKEMLIAADGCVIDGKVTSNNIYKAMIGAIE